METIIISHLVSSITSTSFECCYYAIIGSSYLKLFMHRINFYDENGIVVTCRLSQSVGFTMTVDCAFHIRKSIEYNRNEVFAVKADLGSIKADLGSISKDSQYILYIPASAVGLRKVRTYCKQADKNGLTLQMYTKWSFKAIDLCIYNTFNEQPDFRTSEDKQRVIFERFKENRLTKKGEMVEMLKNTIDRTCGIYLSHEAISKLIDKFELKYKGPVDRLNNPIYKGAKVKWYDPDEESRDLTRKWYVDKIKFDADSNEHDDAIILIYDQYSEAEVFPCELEVIC